MSKAYIKITKNMDKQATGGRDVAYIIEVAGHPVDLIDILTEGVISIAEQSGGKLTTAQVLGMLTSNCIMMDIGKKHGHIQQNKVDLTMLKKMTEKLKEEGGEDGAK